MSLQVEGFDANLRGHRILVAGKEHDLLVRLGVLEGEALYKGRSILVLQEQTRNATVPLALLKRRWDAVFRVREPFEVQMLATYVGAAPKPVRVVWYCLEGFGEIPRGLWSRWSGADVTLIGGSAGMSGMMSVEWDCIFFPKDATESVVERYLTARGTGCRSLLTVVSGHLGEIAASGAALVWNKLEEDDSKGNLYWYDPAEGTATLGKLSKKDVSGMLEEISRWIALEG